ncbi:hypothetical protein AMJ82_07030, partial [candidate division TA06 bacterium SM23_40]
AIYRPFPQAVPNKFVIDRQGTPPCQAACPLHVNAQGYTALISAGKYREALALVRERNPFPGITGRVCHHPCEAACERATIDEAIAIDFLKRFVADRESDLEWDLEIAEEREERVAIVGSGPAGLVAAYDLRRRGYGVTVFEALPVLGGMLAVGIPSYRLPRDLLEGEIDVLKRLGVEFRLGTRIGREVTLEELVAEGYGAIFLGLGAHVSRKLGIDGEDLEGVWGAVEFLRSVNLGEKVRVGKRAAVIGGGNAAIDAARTLLRLGCEDVSIVYRRSRVEMPAMEREIVEAEHEGVKIEYLTLPTKVIGSGGKVVAMECVRMELGEPDESGRRRPIPIEGSEFRMEIDMVVPAISQSPDLEGVGEGVDLEITRWGSIAADPVTLATSVSGVFAGGDAVTGPRTYIEAMAQGRKAAISIDRYLRGADMAVGREGEGPFETDVKPDTRGVGQAPRAVMPTLELGERAGDFREVDLGFDEEQAVSEAVSEAKRCLNCAGCSECKACVAACEPDAIRHGMEDEFVDLHVGAVVVATGLDYYDPEMISEYGYKRFKNVVTSLELERLLSASGPTRGHLVRPGDEKEPERVAFIQCVGSRSEKRGIHYCSRICCMNAIKDALLLEQHAPGTEAIIFYMDIRAFGKGFEAFYLRSKDPEAKTRYIRGKPSKIEEDPETGDLFIHYEDTERARIESMRVDMAVLASALVPPERTADLGTVLGIELGTDAFFKCRDDVWYPLDSTRPGIYLAGCATGPKDITDSIAEASGVAALAARHVLGERVVPEKVEIPPLELAEEPRVGIFVCDCGLNIAAVVDVPGLVERMESLPGVAHIEEVLFACAETTQRKIQDAIREHGLNRVVVAACTPRTHEPIFRETCAKVGLNPFLFEMANIRDQCSWVHQAEPEAATRKAADLIRMSVARARLLDPLAPRDLEVGHDVLVVGGGISGIQTAIDLAARDFKVYLVEKADQLGGRVVELTSLYPSGRSGRELIEEKVRELNSLGVEVRTGTEVEDIVGFVGNFDVTLRRSNDEKEKLSIGAIVLGVGADLYKPEDEYGYGRYPNVITNMELEKMLGGEGPVEIAGGPVRTVAYVQCVGSRGEKGNPECSRYCCHAMLKQAIELRRRGVNVVVLHRDIRVYSRGAEEMYRDARRLGVLFIRYWPEEPPRVEGDGRAAKVIIHERSLETDLELDVDAVVLSLGMVPREEETAMLHTMLKIPRSVDGFFLEVHPKFGPVDTQTEGIFLCGCAQSPKDIADSIAQASAAASRVGSLLARDTITLEPITSIIDEMRCRGCGTCAEVCEFHAIEVVELEDGRLVAKVNEALCKGCGTCASVCPSGAAQIRHFTDEQIETMVEAMLVG